MKLYGNSRKSGTRAYGQTAVQEKRSPEEKAKIQAQIRAYQRKKRMRRKKLITVFAGIIILIGGVFAAYRIWVSPPPLVVPEAEAPGIEGAAPDNANTNGRKKDVYTFIVVGIDQEAGLTDTILTGALDVKEKTLNVVSIPRDTAVKDPDGGTDKANQIYRDRKEKWLSDSGYKDILGYTPDSYVVVDLDAVKQIVDAMGGVSFDVPQRMFYEDPGQNLYIDLQAGQQTLNGDKALQYLRYREPTYGDIGRIKRQQEFLMTIAKQLLSFENLTKINAFVKIFSENVKTGLELKHIAWYAEKLRGLDSENIHFRTLPGNYNDSINGASYVTVNPNEWLEMLNTYLNPFTREITLNDLTLVTRNSSGKLYTTK